MNKKCPYCDSSEGVREFLYGMPYGEPDETKYVLGGCVVFDAAPDYKCLTCGLEFHIKRKEKEGYLERG
jgi:DNA-directed RNA polymerase subunit RPC12/RpoP